MGAEGEVKYAVDLSWNMRSCYIALALHRYIQSQGCKSPWVNFNRITSGDNHTQLQVPIAYLLWDFRPILWNVTQTFLRSFFLWGDLFWSALMFIILIWFFLVFSVGALLLSLISNFRANLSDGSVDSQWILLTRIS